MVTASLVFGVLGIIFTFFTAGILGFPISLIGLIISIIARHKDKSSQSRTGLVLNIVSFVISTLLFLIIFSIISAIPHS